LTGVWAAVAGSGTVVRVILGGDLRSGLGWQCVLLVDVPVVRVAAFLALRLIDESRADTAERSTDVPGALLVSGGLVAALYAVINALSPAGARRRRSGCSLPPPRRSRSSPASNRARARR
jgi:hypothetical protein